ncbi:MAG: FecR domain-containing protein [Terriglobales bacterium]
MKTQRAFLWIVIMLVLMGIVLPAQAAPPPKEPTPKVGPKAGTITALLPVATVSRRVGKQLVTTEAKKGEDLVWDDLLKTLKGGRARVTLADQSILSLGSQAELKIVKHDNRSQQTALQLYGGRVRAEVAKITRQGGSFELRTPTAVAGVIGTDFGTDASSVGTSTFLCISGVVQVANVDPNVTGSVQCAAGLTTTVSPGKPPTIPTNATPQQIQQLILDTEPAIITAMTPMQALPGAALDATISGQNMGAVNKASATGPSTGVTATLSGTPTATSAVVHVVVAPTAAPGMYLINLTKPSGANSTASFNVLAPPTPATSGDLKKPYHDQIETERQTARAGLASYVTAAQQSANQVSQSLQQANQGNAVDLTQATTNLNNAVATVQTAVDQAGGQIDAAALSATTEFDTSFQTAFNALLQRNPAGAPDQAFNDAVQAIFQQVNTTLGTNFNTITSALSGASQTAGGSIGQTAQTWMTTIGAAIVQPPVPAVNASERSIDWGAAFGGSIAAVDASKSQGVNGATITRYNWVLCNESYKPAQFGVAIPASTTGCSPKPGFASSNSDFPFGTCNLTAGTDYIARVTVTDSNNQQAAMDVKVHVLAGAYDDPATRLKNMAGAYSSLNISQFLGFFDQTNFPGYTVLEQNVRANFPKLASMNVLLRQSQASTSCSDPSAPPTATMRADWLLNYTFPKTCQTTPVLLFPQPPDLNSCSLNKCPDGSTAFLTATNQCSCNVTSCSDPSVVFTQEEQLSARMLLTPGKGWNFVDFQGDNGSVSGSAAIALPGPVAASVNSSAPDLLVSGVFPSYASSSSPSALAFPPGNQPATAVIFNAGTAALTSDTTVQFNLQGGSGTLATVTMPLPGPLSPGASVLVPATIPVPTNLPIGTPMTLVATVDPQCNTSPAETSCSNNTASQPLLLASPITLTQAAPVNLLSGGQPQTLTVNVTNVNAAASVSLALPAGITLAAGSNPLSQNVTAATTLTWIVQADFTAVPGNPPPGAVFNMVANVQGFLINVPVTYSVTGPTVSESNAPTIISGAPASGTTASQIIMSASIAGTYTLVLPTGVSTVSPNPQTITAPGNLIWDIQSNLGVAANTYTAPVTIGRFSFPATFTILSPTVTQSPTGIPSLTVGGPTQTLTATVNVPGIYTLVLPQGVTTSSANPQTVGTPVLAQRGAVVPGGGPFTLSWTIQAGTTAATGSHTMNITSGAYSFPMSYSVAGPTFSQTAIPAMLTNSPAQTLSVAVNTGGTFTLTPPVGVTIASGANPQTLPSTGGTLTWTLAADFGATSGAGLTMPISEPNFTFQAAYSVTGPTFSGANIPALIIGDAPQTLSVNVNVPGNYGISPPAGIFINGTCTAPTVCVQTILSPTGGALNWSVQAGFAAQTGSALAMPINGLTPSNALSSYALSASYSAQPPTMVEGTPPSLLAGGASQSISFTTNATVANFILSQPAGTTVTPSTAQAPVNGTLTWTISAGTTAATGTSLPITVTEMNQANPSQYTFPGTYTVAGPTILQTATPAMIAGDTINQQSLSISVNSGGTFSLTLPPGITANPSTPQTLPQAGGPLTWGLTSSFSATVGSFTPTTSTLVVGDGNFSQVMAYSVNAPTYTERNTPNLLPAGASQQLLVDINVPGTFTLGTLPTGVTISSGANPQTLTSAGTLTWSVVADNTAIPGSYQTTISAAGQFPFQAIINVAAPTITQTVTPTMLSGDTTAQTLSFTTDSGGTYQLLLPTGVTTTSPNPQTIGPPTAGPATVTFNLVADFTATAGNFTASASTLIVKDGNFSFPMAYNINGQPNYKFQVNPIFFDGTSAGHAQPFQGPDAFQVGEMVTVVAQVENAGNASPSGTVTVSITCAGPSGCPGSFATPVQITAPTAGAGPTPVTLTFTSPLALPVQAASLAYTWNVQLTALDANSRPIPQPTADDVYSAAFDMVDFHVTISTPDPVAGGIISGTQYGLNDPNQPSQILAVLDESGNPSTFPLNIVETRVFNNVPTTVQQFNSVPAGGTAGDSTIVLAPGAYTYTFNGIHRGVTRNATQPFNSVSVSVTPANVFVNDASNPLEIQIGQAAPQEVDYNISATFFSGSVTVTVPANAGNFLSQSADLGNSNTGSLPLPATPFHWDVTCASGCTAPTTLNANIVLPSSNPSMVVQQPLFVIGHGVPDLKITSVTLPRTLNTSAPWLAGEPLDIIVRVTNLGPTASAGGESLTMFLQGAEVDNGNVTVPQLQPCCGPTSFIDITVHAVAPDLGPSFTSSSASLRTKVAADTAGDLNYANNSCVGAGACSQQGTGNQSVATANWHVAVSGNGSSDNTPLTVTLPSPGNATAALTGSVDGCTGTCTPGQTIAWNFNPTAGVMSPALDPCAGSSCFSAGGNSTSFNMLISGTNANAQSGLYTAQAIIQLIDSHTGLPTAQRQATVHVSISNGTNALNYPLTLTCLIGNGPNRCDPNGQTATTVQLNGIIPQPITVQITPTCTPTAGQTCTGTADLTVTDDPATTTTPQQVSQLSFSTNQVLNLTAAVDATGNITVGPTGSYAVSLSGIQRFLKRGSTAPDPVGVVTSIPVQVGDVIATADISNNCLAVPPSATQPTSLLISVAAPYFTVPTVTLDWQPATSAPLNIVAQGSTTLALSSPGAGGTYGTITYNITNVGPAQDGLLSYLLRVTPNIVNNTGAAKFFLFYFDTSITQNFCGAAGRVRGTVRVPGSWSRSAILGGAGTATLASRSAQVKNSGNIDLHILAADVSYTPSIPKVGDTVQIRFRVSNSGSGDATGVPIALQINGTTVASDTFNVGAGRSTLGALNWDTHSLPAGTGPSRITLAQARVPGRLSDRGNENVDIPETNRPLGRTQAMVVIDPQHTVKQLSTADKSAALAHFSLRSGDATGSAGLSSTASSQHILLEVQEGACVGLRMNTGSAGPCGSATVEMTVEEAVKGGYTLSALDGIADLGATTGAASSRLDSARLSAARYSSQLAAMTGHSYAVQLSGGRAGLLIINSIRNPNELSAQARALFRSNAVRILRGLGGSSGPAETGDVAGRGRSTAPTVFVDITVQMQ